VIYDNLYLSGNIFPGYDPLLERSLEGVALATAFRVAQELE
jgi:anaerobic glycerol-3-phosphate dehydrogenase